VLIIIKLVLWNDFASSLGEVSGLF